MKGMNRAASACVIPSLLSPKSAYNPGTLTPPICAHPARITLTSKRTVGKIKFIVLIFSLRRKDDVKAVIFRTEN